MILLKADYEMKTIFLKMIKTMGENVKWTEIFVINNNDIILVGKSRSLFFNFDTRRTYGNIIELPVNIDKAELISENPLLVNSLNMILYVFGKWGEIKGLTVEKNYDQLNKLLNTILKEIEIECTLTKDNFRFYKNGVKMTYEEVIQLTLDKYRIDDKDVKEELNEESTEKDTDQDSEGNKETESNQYKLGLWHNMCWTTAYFTFEKEEITEREKERSRLGNNFYLSSYNCPLCGEKLYLVIYPEGKEFRIETDEAAILMARAYTCNKCNSFYTPKPHKLLAEGSVFNLSFEDAREAYEDYLELLGRQGERTSNCNFNLYESEYNNNKKDKPPALEEICNDLESMSEQEILDLKDKMDSGFYPQISVDFFYDKVEAELKDRRNPSNKKDRKNKDKKSKDKKEKDKKEKDRKEKDKRDKDRLNDDRKNSGKKEKERSVEDRKSEDKKYEGREINPIGTGENSLSAELDNLSEEVHTSTITAHSLVRNSYKSEDSKASVKQIQKDNIKKNKNDNRSSFTENEFFSNILEGLDEILAALKRGDYNLFNDKADKLNLKQLENLKLLIQSDQELEKGEKNQQFEYINNIIHAKEEKELFRKAESAKEKSYHQILSIIEEIKKENCDEKIKIPILDSLKEILKVRGKNELDYLVSHIPENFSKKQFTQLRDEVDQYQDIDNSFYQQVLEDKRDTVEKQEIAAFIKRFPCNNRTSLFEIYNKLKQQSFEKRNVTSFLDKIYDKIRAFDEAVIQKLCPEPADLSFEEGVEIYEEISSQDLLPELKTNVLALIDKRLIKLKMDECEQLVNKLSKDLDWTVEKYPRLHMYDVRKMMMRHSEDADSVIIQNALNTYASGRGKYEYPILICDSSIHGNGKEGFVLTPDHLFFNSLLNSDVLNVMDIGNVFFSLALFKKGIYVTNKNNRKVKISNALKLNNMKSFAEIMNDYINYLKEKPESRKISYMAKEKHVIKCCYRCGYIYKRGNICPKCGSKQNE
jgi:hypothetical protein